MQIKLKDASYDVVVVDPYEEAQRDILGASRLKGPALNVVKELFNTSDRLVLRYDCKKPEEVQYLVPITDGKIRIAQRLFIIGLTGQGITTPRTTDRLTIKILDETGYASIGVLDDDLNDRLGAQNFEVPLDAIFAKWGRHISFEVEMTVQWHLWSVTLPKDYPKGLVYIAFPSRVQFRVRPGLNCKTGRQTWEAGNLKRFRFDPTFMVPKEKAARKVVEDGYAARIKAMDDSIAYWSTKLAGFKASILGGAEETFDIQNQMKSLRKLIKEEKAKRKGLKDEASKFSSR